MSKLLIYSMHRTDAYWRHIARRLEMFDSATVVADQLRCGDISTQPRFYELLKGREPERFVTRQLGESLATDIILRCRVLRSIDRQQAIRMVGAMWMSQEEIVRMQKPDLAMSFCIDRYSMDILARVCESKSIPFVELTASVLPSKILLMRRGRGLRSSEPQEQDIQEGIQTLSNPEFSPSYVQTGSKYSLARLLKTFSYFELRGAYFNMVRFVRQDPLNCHYLDALKRLRHKIGYRDLRQLSYFQADWKPQFDETPFEKRVFLGLQLYPEASMDYWLQPHDLLRYYDVLERQIELLSGAGFHIFVKDHPLMFGFRQVELLERLKRHPNVVLVPNEVSGRFLVNGCKSTLTLTGTVGLEAAMAGRCAVTAAGGYYYLPGETVAYQNFHDMSSIPARIRDWTPGNVESRQRALVSHLVAVSAPGSLSGVAGFDARNEETARWAEKVAQSLNERLPRLGEALSALRMEGLPGQAVGAVS